MGLAKPFDDTLSEYLKVCTRSMTEAMNNKGYFIARAALWYTHKASAENIGDTLGRFVSTLNLSRKNKSGRFTTRRTLETLAAREADAPLAALIVNARRAEKGQPGLRGIDDQRGALLTALLGAPRKNGVRHKLTNNCAWHIFQAAARIGTRTRAALGSRHCARSCASRFFASAKCRAFTGP